MWDEVDEMRYPLHACGIDVEAIYSKEAQNQRGSKEVCARSGSPLPKEEERIFLSRCLLRVRNWASTFRSRKAAARDQTRFEAPQVHRVLRAFGLRVCRVLKRHHSEMNLCP